MIIFISRPHLCIIKDGVASVLKAISNWRDNVFSVIMQNERRPPVVMTLIDIKLIVYLPKQRLR